MSKMNSIEMPSSSGRGVLLVLRKIAIVLAAVALTCALIVLDARAEGSIAAAPVVSPDKGYFVQEIRDGVYWVGDGAYNTMFVVTAAGVVAVDPLPTLGARYLRAIVEITDKPVSHIIYSHEHFDHIGAASLFPKDAVVIAQDETA